MWKDGVFLGFEDTTEEVVVGNRNTVWPTRTVLRTAPDRLERSDLENDRGARTKMTIMENAMKERLRSWTKKRQGKGEMEEYVLRTMTSVFNATARCSGCVSTIRGTARQAHTENGRKRIKGEWRGKEEAAQRRVKEEVDQAVVR